MKAVLILCTIWLTIFAIAYVCTGMEDDGRFLGISGSYLNE